MRLLAEMPTLNKVKNWDWSFTSLGNFMYLTNQFVHDNDIMVTVDNKLFR